MRERAILFLVVSKKGLGTKLGTQLGTIDAKTGTIEVKLDVTSIENRIKTKWRRTQVVRERSAKPLCDGSNPPGASRPNRHGIPRNLISDRRLVCGDG